MQSQKSIEIQRLRAVILNDAESPVERLVAARRLLSKYGPSERNVPLIRRVINLFERDTNADVAERCLKLKGQLLKRLDLQAVACLPIEDSPDDQPEVVSDVAVGPSTEDVQAAAAILPDKAEFPWPPKGIVFPPPKDVYEMGSIDMTGLASRLRGLPFPALTTHEANQDVVRAALGLSGWVPIELPLLQKVFLAFAYEPKATDPSRSANDWSRYWPYAKLFAAVWYLGLKFGYGSLKDPPPGPDYVRSLLRNPLLSVYEKREELPRAIAAARLYRHLPGFNELLTEIEGGNHV